MQKNEFNMVGDVCKSTSGRGPDIVSLCFNGMSLFGRGPLDVFSDSCADNYAAKMMRTRLPCHFDLTSKREDQSEEKKKQGKMRI